MGKPKVKPRMWNGIEIPPIEEDEFSKYIVEDMACPQDKPSSTWTCSMEAPLRKTWGDAYGFNKEEAKKTKNYRNAGQTEDQMKALRPPAFSRTAAGYLVMKIPDPLYKVIQQAYGKGRKVKEPPPGMYYSNSYEGEKDRQWEIVSLDFMLPVREFVSDYMARVQAWWVDHKYKLKHEATYGIRVYKDQAMLINHRDTTQSHLISAVLQVAQECGEDGWPLMVEDAARSGGTMATSEYKEVYLQPGYMVLYEGARYYHGRPRRFTGKNFANIFTHFRPYAWNLDDLRRKGFQSGGAVTHKDLGIEPPDHEEDKSHEEI